MFVWRGIASLKKIIMIPVINPNAPTKAQKSGYFWKILEEDFLTLELFFSEESDIKVAKRVFNEI